MCRDHLNAFVSMVGGEMSERYLDVAYRAYSILEDGMTTEEVKERLNKDSYLKERNKGEYNTTQVQIIINAGISCGILKEQGERYELSGRGEELIDDIDTLGILQAKHRI